MQSQKQQENVIGSGGASLKQWPDFYSILDSTPDTDSETLRRSINTLYVKANEGSDHRELSTRFYNQVLSQKVLPQCRSILLNDRARQAYNQQWYLHRDGAEAALSYGDFIRQITKGSGSASALLLSDNEIAILPTLHADQKSSVLAPSTTVSAEPKAPASVAAPVVSAPASAPIQEVFEGQEVLEGEEVIEPVTSAQISLTPPVTSAVVMAPSAPLAPKKSFPLVPVLGVLVLLAGVGGYALKSRAPAAVDPASADSKTSLNHLYTLARNADFEVPGMASWVVSGRMADNVADANPQKNASVNGKVSMTFHNQKPYDIDVRQTITGLKAGKYMMRAWAKQGEAPKTAEMFVEGYGGTRRTVPLPQGWTWAMMTIKDIQVTSGQCTIGFAFKSDNPKGGVGNVDAVEFFHQ